MRLHCLLNITGARPGARPVKTEIRVSAVWRVAVSAKNIPRPENQRYAIAIGRWQDHGVDGSWAGAVWWVSLSWHSVAQAARRAHGRMPTPVTVQDGWRASQRRYLSGWIPSCLCKNFKRCGGVKYTTQIDCRGALLTQNKKQGLGCIVRSTSSVCHCLSLTHRASFCVCCCCCRRHCVQRLSSATALCAAFAAAWYSSLAGPSSRSIFPMNFERNLVLYRLPTVWFGNRCFNGVLLRVRSASLYTAIPGCWNCRTWTSATWSTGGWASIQILLFRSDQATARHCWAPPKQTYFRLFVDGYEQGVEAGKTAGILDGCRAGMKRALMFSVK